MSRPSLRATATVLALGLSATLLGAGLMTDDRTGTPKDKPPKGSTAPEVVTGADALVRRARSELRRFTRWCASQGVQCYIGEVGWPSDQEDADRWNSLADAWYRDADRANLWVTAWAAGEWWPQGYRLDIYPEERRGPGAAGANPQAAVVEAHPSTDAYLRGVNVNGGEFGRAPSREATSPFSNANPGRYGTDYQYDSQASFGYLAGRGVRLVRLPFRWERLQPEPGGPLDAEEVSRLREAVARAGSAGLSVIVEPHNYGAYYLSDGSRGVRQPIGSASVTSGAFADLWRRISEVFRGEPTVIGYGLMNEPIGLKGEGRRGQAVTWERISQQAVDAIRRSGDNKLVVVPGYNYSGAAGWVRHHPSAWIRDPANAVRYEAHQYFDSDQSGSYEDPYAAEVAHAKSIGF